MPKKKGKSKGTRLQASKPSDYAITTLRSSFGQQCSSGISNSPRCGFGTAARGDISKSYQGLEFDRATLRSTGGPSHVSGPAAYRTYSAFGKSLDSRKSSGTNTRFGSGPNYSSTRTVFRNPTPGPGEYRNTTAIGPQAISRHRTGQKATFGTATREKQERVFASEEHAKSIGGTSPYHRMNPGPATYTLQGGLGKQVNSQKKSQASWKMGTSLRSSIAGSNNNPGPGAYRAEHDGVGKQYLSRARTAPSAPFGTGTRDARAMKVYVSSEHEGALFGTHSPGPATGIQTSSLAKQSMSHMNSNPSHVFGTAVRIATVSTDSPGPGAYYA